MASRRRETTQYNTYGSVAYAPAYEGGAIRIPRREEEQHRRPQPKQREHVRRRELTRTQVQVRQAGQVAPFAVIGFLAVAAFAALLLLVLDNANVTLPEINTLERDVPDLTAGSVVYELYLSGVLNGVDEYGTFDGQHTVTRGQAAAMLARLVDPAQRLKLSFQSFSQCRDILGVDPAAVLLMVDGADFTAEDCSEALYQGLRKQ